MIARGSDQRTASEGGSASRRLSAPLRAPRRNGRRFRCPRPCRLDRAATLERRGCLSRYAARLGLPFQHHPLSAIGTTAGIGEQMFEVGEGREGAGALAFWVPFAATGRPTALDPEPVVHLCVDERPVLTEAVDRQRAICRGFGGLTPLLKLSVRSLRCSGVGRSV